jgi:hypothetical protein
MPTMNRLRQRATRERLAETETTYLLRSQRNARRLLASIRELDERGKKASPDLRGVRS